jgi:hypothetical protein
MSHELRTPLNSIIGFTGVLLQQPAGPLNAEQMQQLEMLHDSARHLLWLINDVLDISKIEAGQLEVAGEPFDLRASIDKVVGIIAPLAEQKGLALRAEIAPEVGQAVGDPRRVEQILLNLLNNAVKFTDQGEVHVTARLLPGKFSVLSSQFSVNNPEDETAEGAGIGQEAGTKNSKLKTENSEVESWVELRVTDTGVGIKPEDLATLFQPFRQIDSALSRNHEGTSLGLAICRRLADLMGGDIQAESEWGKGSMFSVTLPLKGPVKS